MNSGCKAVFVVDDDARQCEIIGGFLENQGYRVLTAPNAEKAIGLLDELTPDLVLMDVRMPGMGGIEGLERMRERLPALSVILLTAYADVRDAVDAMRKGAVDYLEKPVDLQELQTILIETIGAPESPAEPELPPLPEGFVVAGASLRRIRLAESGCSTAPPGGPRYWWPVRAARG